MKNMTPDENFKSVLDAVATVLKEVGFVRAGANMRHITQDCAAIVQFQRSVSSTIDSIRFTVNLGVVCGALYSDGKAKLKKAKLIDAHLVRRIGDFLPSSPDKWWVLDRGSDVETVTREILSILVDVAIPFIVEHASNAALIDLWRSGNSPGLTEGQRKRYLDELSAAAN